MSRIALINYGMGNLRSVSQALQAVGADVRVCERPGEVGDADGMVLPGVGALADCVSALHSSGFAPFVREWIAADRPFLGVCLGLQALFDHSEEGDVAGLGIFPGRVVRFRRPPEFKIPHMGWNTVTFRDPASPLLDGLRPAGESFYFVHSYHVVPDDPALTFGTCDYGGEFTAAIARGRCFATQCHPEKSQARGLQLYRNFVRLATGVAAG
jgi:imidazole glycerol-phosphate synthase subunit HisH